MKKAGNGGRSRGGQEGAHVHDLRRECGRSRFDDKGEAIFNFRRRPAEEGRRLEVTHINRIERDQVPLTLPSPNGGEG